MGLVVAEKEKEGEIECIIIIITASHGYTELLRDARLFLFPSVLAGKGLRAIFPMLKTNENQMEKKT